MFITGAKGSGGKRVPVDLPEQRKIALLFVATGSIFTVIASLLGFFMLLGRSSGPVLIDNRIFSVHPYLQIFGFLTEFVMGVAYALIPSFKSYGLRSYRGAYYSFFLVTAANVGYITSGWIVNGSPESIAVKLSALTLELAGAGIFVWEVMSPLRLGRKTSLSGDAYFVISALSLPASVLCAVFETVKGRDVLSTGFLYTALIGFVGSMIFGVVMKTSAVRFTTSYGKAYPAGVYSQGIAVSLAVVSVIIPGSVQVTAASIAFIISAALYITTSRTIVRSRLLLPPGNRQKAHLQKGNANTNLRYIEQSLMISSFWLITGLFFGLLYSISGYFWVRIAFIHSIGIGFIGSTIIGIAPVLLPGILSRKAPSESNSFIPLYLLSSGLAIFAGGDLVSLDKSGLPPWTWIGGALILAAMMLFFYTIHSSLISKKEKAAERTGFSDDW